MNKICTSIEQSKKLIELGIDVSTADMYWWNNTEEKRYEASLIDYAFISDMDIPAWSLTALLNILPTIDEDYEPEIHRSCNKYICTYQNDEDSSGLFRASDNPIDAVFEIILKLHEIKLL